ncbi:hypothetical protein KSF_081640 [Reticulibacter mediterranei]|uniref:Uncharacterized protein n=1 Tax=Reticulibacter mediterranei TaxID=2778369 RepID=A0A8J3IXZ4_9CHLR|nr:hypothetical protein [Reticulibacter mediterranei]GHO98116.1 hypothetical protein KSF_081640 [Reticulibacter mediterranei]
MRVKPDEREFSLPPILESMFTRIVKLSQEASRDLPMSGDEILIIDRIVPSWVQEQALTTVD